MQGMEAGALLPPRNSGGHVSPLRAWTAAQQALLKRSLADTLAAWQADWGVAGSAVAAQVELHDGFADLAGQASARKVRDAAQAERVLHNLLFGDRAYASFNATESSTVAGQLAEAAWQDWLQRLARLLGFPDGAHGASSGFFASPGTSAAPDAVAPWPSPWSGDLLAWLPWGRETLELRLRADGVENVLRRGAAELAGAAGGSTVPVAPPIPVDRALAGRSLRVRGELGTVTLALGQLQELGLGDVVALPHRLDQPLELRLADSGSPQGLLLCRAWLGQAQGRIALELARPA